MRELVQEIDDFAKANPDKPNAAKMGEQLRNLLEGTLKDQLEGRQPITDQQVLGYDGQIKGAQGELAEGNLPPRKRFSTKSSTASNSTRFVPMVHCSRPRACARLVGRVQSSLSETSRIKMPSTK